MAGWTFPPLLRDKKKEEEEVGQREEGKRAAVATGDSVDYLDIPAFLRRQAD